jgi:hypothetical protein
MVTLFLRNGMELEFLDYFQKSMSDYFEIFSYKEILELKLYGIGNEHPRFFDRAGDYTLIAKKDIAIGNFV